jgi:hypothetical protein
MPGAASGQPLQCELHKKTAIINCPGCPAASIAFHAGAIPHQSEVALLSDTAAVPSTNDNS